jgi:nucleotide-binding universal stress UspA family protein
LWYDNTSIKENGEVSMLRSILVPLDGSEFAEKAIPLALSIADRAGASLELLRVHELYALHDTHACWSPYEPAEDAAFRDKEQAYLEAATRQLQGRSSAAITFALVNGPIEDAIVRRTRTRLPDLIVMATHGRSPISRLCGGSVAEKLILNGRAPILLIHPGKTRERQRPKLALRRILIPLDGSELAECALKPAIAIGRLMGADYTLVQTVDACSRLDGFATVVQPRVIEYGCEQRRTMAQAYLNRVAARMRSKGLCSLTHVVSGKSPADAVLDVARDEGIDLIAIAARGRGALRRLLFGSVAESIAWRSPLPVLVYCPN